MGDVWPQWQRVSERHATLSTSTSYRDWPKTAAQRAKLRKLSMATLAGDVVETRKQAQGGAADKKSPYEQKR